MPFDTVTVPRARFTMCLVENVVCIEDEDGDVSVTNDAEAIIAYLDELGLLGASKTRPVVYRDTLGQWDQLAHEGGRFTGYLPCSTRSREEAVEKAIHRPRTERARQP